MTTSAPYVSRISGMVAGSRVKFVPLLTVKSSTKGHSISAMVTSPLRSSSAMAPSLPVGTTLMVLMPPSALKPL
jgi:hypothetical protein